MLPPGSDHDLKGQQIRNLAVHFSKRDPIDQTDRPDH